MANPTSGVVIPTASSVKARTPGRDERLFPLLLTLPTLVTVLFVVGFPWGYSAWLSLHEVDMATRTWTFVGLDNYTRVVPDTVFRESLARTLYFAVLTVGGGVLVGLGAALVLNERLWGRGVMRSILLVPWATSSVVVGILWYWIYNGQYGTLNGLLFKFGLISDYIPWLRDGFTALNLVGIAYIWHTAPLAALLFLAGLQAIPPSLYGAAKIDGASAWSRFLHITLPWLRPMMLNVLLLTTINSIMAFDLIYVMTAGGPGSATTVFAWLGYATTFQFFRFGEGSAVLYLLSILCLILALFYIRLLYRRSPVKQMRQATLETGGTAPMPTAPFTPVSISVRGQSGHFVPPQRLFGLTARRRLNRGFLHFLLFLVAVWSIGPFLWMVICSLVPATELLAKPPRFIPWPITFVNYEALFRLQAGAGGLALGASAKQVPAGLVNSLIVSTSVTVISLVIGSLAGYAYARYNHWFMRGTLMLLLLTRMIPAIAIVIPFFMMFRETGLQDS
ncbi:MAG: ABC transporter permease subunit, partial [Coriobacteriia bacterium]